MNRINPYTGEETRPLTKDELEPYLEVEDIDPDYYNGLPGHVRCSFEFAAENFVMTQPKTTQKKVAEFNDLEDNVPSYDDSEEDLIVWISELIQNAHDAAWKVESKTVGPTTFSFDIDSDSFTFRHDGRPPQWIAFDKHEVEKMARYSTSKSNQHATEGQFGIGFKIWILLFDRIELQYGHCKLVMEVNRGDHPHFEHQVEWVDECQDDFSIRATEPLEDTKPILDKLSKSGMIDLYSRSVNGLVLRPYPFEITVNTPNETEVVKKVEDTTTPVELKELGFNVWRIEAKEHHALPDMMVTYNRPIRALQSENQLEKVLRDEIGEDKRRERIFRGLKKKDDINQAVKETLDAFDATIAIVPNGAYEGALYNSLFPIPGADKENITSRGLHFVAKFAMDTKRENLSKKGAEERRNQTLMMAFLECYLSLMDELKNPESRSAFNIGTEAYFGFLRIFSDTVGSNDGVKTFVKEIRKLLMSNSYSNDVITLFELFDIYPLQDGGFATYLDVKQLRPEVRLLLEDVDESMRAWGRLVLDKNEAIAIAENGELRSYDWEVEEWSQQLHLSMNADPFQKHAGPAGLSVKRLVEHLKRLEEFGCPHWLKMPYYQRDDEQVKWFTLDELDNHILTSGPEDETLQETAFETAIVAELEALGVHEYTIDPSWFEYIRSLEEGKAEGIIEKMCSAKNLFSKRANTLTMKCKDGGHAFFLGLLSKHPQPEARFPFFLLSGTEECPQVIKLNEQIPESVLFLAKDGPRVVRCKKTSKHWKVMDKMRLVCDVLGSSEKPTHLFIDREAERIIQDILQVSVLPTGSITVERTPKGAAPFHGMACRVPQNTSENVVATVLAWVNKVPHVGVTLKIKSNFARDVFDVQLPGQLRKGSGQNKDEYVVVRETSYGEKDPDKAKKYNDANFVHRKVAEALIGTDLDKEKKLSNKANKQDWWEKSISQGVFSVLFRVSSFPTIIAEWLIQNPTKERYLDYLRLLRFRHMDLNPSFLHLCLADYYYVTRNSWRARNIKILCQKFNPGEIATRNSGVELMAELQGQYAYVGVVPEDLDSALKEMMPMPPDVASTVGANTFASHWNLSQGKLSRIVFLHALRHGFVLMGDEVLLQHSQFFNKHPTMVAEALKQLEALEHALIPQKEYPLDGQALFDHIFLHVPGQSFNLPQRDLVESIRDKCEEAEISIERNLAHTIEALILSQHEFVARINEEKLPKYWGDLHAAGLEEFEVEGVEWSPPFKLILDEAKKYRPRKKRFVEAVTSVTDPRKALNLLRMDDPKRVFYGATLEGKKSIQISNHRPTYYVEPRPSGRIFPLTTKQEWISEHSPIFRDNNSIVLVPTRENHEAIQAKFSAKLAEHDLHNRIVDEVKRILNLLHKHHVKARTEHRDVGDEQRNAHEFLRRGILRYVAECTRGEVGGPPIVDLLQQVYGHVEIKTLTLEEAKSAQMFPGSEDAYLSNVLLGPCGIGWQLCDGRLTLTMGPWLNRDWTEGKIGWARDLFDGLLDDIRLDKPMLRKDFAMERGDLKFLTSVFVNAFEQSDKWLESYQSDLLPLDSDFEAIYNDRGWMNPDKTDDLIERILSDIEKHSSQGRLPEASSSLKLMYDEDMICTISGYLEPEPTGSNKMFTVRLRRPSGSGQQAVLALNGPRPEVLQGWESLGNTLWVSDRAAIRGQRDGGWRLKAPEGESGSFVEHLAEDLQSLYKESPDDEYIRIPDVVAFQHEDGHADARFNLQLHKLHALYVVAFDKYCKDKPTS